MAHRHLFRHPVGFFPARARWYLAGASMTALLLVAAHLAVQVHTQDRAEATVNQWMQQSGGSVEHVRFHLLRNALTLDGVRLSSGDMSLYIPEVLLYGRVDSLLSTRPTLTRVSMSAPRLSLPAAAMLRLLASQPEGGDTMFHQIWRMARHLEIHGGTLMLTGGQGAHAGVFRDLNLLVRQQGEERTVRGSCRYHGAALMVKSSMEHTQAGASGEVDLRWDRLDGRRAAPEVLGLAPLDGEVSGRTQWSWRDPASGQARSQLQGDMHIVSGARVVGDAVIVPSLHWRADRGADGWHAQIAAQAWPLAPLRGKAPIWYGRQLAGGVFSGDAEADWDRPGRGGAVLRVARGSIAHLDYAPRVWGGNAEALPDWKVDRIDMTDAHLDTYGHVLSFGTLALAGGEVRLLPGHALAVQTQGPSWHVDASTFHVDQLALALVFADGQSMLRTLPLSGHGSLFAGSLQGDLAASNGPVSWMITGQGRSPDGHGIRLGVDASGLSLIQLRPVLPFTMPARAGTAVQLDGSADFKLAVDVSPGAWTASGKVDAANVAVAWQGASWRAAHVSVNLDQVGTGVPAPAISQLQVTGWQYQGALQPLTAAINPAAGDAGSLLPWRIGSAWRIDAMHWQGGTVSFGRADAVWGSDVDWQLLGWGDGKMATVKLSADVDGGRLQASGAVGRIDGVLHTDIKGSLSSARPFLLNPWLQVSGAPRVIRGRWAARFAWRTDAHGLGHGRLRLWLHRWQLETGVFLHDPFLGRTGFAAHDLLRRIQADRLAMLDVDYTLPPGQRFAWSNLGDVLLARLRAMAADAKPEGRTEPGARLKAETRIRLHGKAGLSHNERVRLRKLWRWLIHDRHLVLDMIPQMEGQHLDAGLVTTVRHTQDMIARFMMDRGIPPRRLFPVWPTRASHVRGSLGIRVEVRRPRPRLRAVSFRSPAH